MATKTKKLRYTPGYAYLWTAAPPWDPKAEYPAHTKKEIRDRYKNAVIRPLPRVIPKDLLAHSTYYGVPIWYNPDGPGYIVDKFGGKRYPKTLAEARAFIRKTLIARKDKRIRK